MAVDPVAPFLWGSGGRRLTPEEIAAERKGAAALGQQAMSTAPVGHWSQGLNRVLQGLMAGYDDYRASDAAKQNSTESAALVQALLGGGAAASATPVAASAMPTSVPVQSSGGVTTPMGNTSIPVPQDDNAARAMAFFQSKGMAPADAAALVWNFQQESGKNLNPTLSHDGGTGFGIAGFRDPTPGQGRWTNLRNFAAENKLDPNSLDTQLQFAWNELQGPESATFQKIQAARTPEEKAAAAIGYFRPRADYAAARAARAGEVNSLLRGQPVQVASNDPDFAPSSPQIVDANQPSPLDTAQYPSGPVGAPAATADGLDPAALPTNAQPAQGVLPTAQAVQAATQPARPAINPAILQAMTSPYVNDQTRQIATLLFKSQMDQQAKANDPMRQLDIQSKQTALTPLGAPYKDADGNLVQKDALGKITVLSAAEKSPTSVQEYKFYRTQAEEAGETPLPYSKWDIARKHAGAISVNTGAIPQGYEQYTDPDTGAIRMRAIPGGPKDASAKDQAKADARATSTEVVTNAAKLAREAISGATFPVTGTAGHFLSGIGETGAAELNRQVSVLKSNATIENLNAMRAQSPTGGALGNVTEGEGAMLAAKSGALDPRAPKAQFQRALDDYERTLLRIVHGKDAGDKIYEQTRPNKDGWSDIGGVKIRRKQ